MSQSIVELVDSLPNDNITVKVLKTISTFVSGKWENLVGFDNTITAVTGAIAPSEISRIRDRAIALYDDKKQGYQTAIWLYRTVDNTDKAISLRHGFATQLRRSPINLAILSASFHF
ncbi:MAG: hypothetical protein QNJ72_20535 [Pleurocapsa sp. MO_226.B13]|nr:hypothetical protein [Pleurocapsa sp. MO_226.B13]